jgi:hypothetical protein
MEATNAQVITVICAVGFRIGTFLIALNQLYANRNKLKIDLFLLRYPIFTQGNARLPRWTTY